MRKIKKRDILLFILGFGILVFGTSASFVFSQYDNVFEGEASCGVVFGAAVWQDNIASHAMYDRVLSGVDLYKDGKVSCLILSGGPSAMGDHETDVMKELALYKGIPQEALRLDYKGINTLATLKNLPKEVASFVMISNDFHLARIRMLSWRLDINAVGSQAAIYRNGRYFREPFFAFREVIANIFYFFHFQI